MGLLTKIKSVLFNTTAETAISSAERVADIVERWKPSEEKKHEMSLEIEKLVNESQNSARRMAIASHNTWFDVLVDGLNRLVRPWITVWLFGGLVGWWTLPSPGQVDPFFLNAFYTILVFWFGGRAVLKDLPKALSIIRK